MPSNNRRNIANATRSISDSNSTLRQFLKHPRPAWLKEASENAEPVLPSPRRNRPPPDVVDAEKESRQHPNTQSDVASSSKTSTRISGAVQTPPQAQPQPQPPTAEEPPSNAEALQQPVQHPDPGTHITLPQAPSEQATVTSPWLVSPPLPLPLPQPPDQTSTLATDRSTPSGTLGTDTVTCGGDMTPQDASISPAKVSRRHGRVSTLSKLPGETQASTATTAPSSSSPVTRNPRVLAATTEKSYLPLPAATSANAAHTDVNRDANEFSAAKRRRLNALDLGACSQHPESCLSNAQAMQALEMSVPMPAPTKTFSELWINDIKALKKAFPPGSVSMLYNYRLDLLREACVKGDLLYLAIHQAYCAWSIGFTDVVQHVTTPNRNQGFSVMQDFTGVNSTMLPDHLKKLATFPLANAFPYFCTLFRRVATFLDRLATRYSELLARWKTRRYLPLVDELVTVLRLTSPTMQAIIFRHVRTLLAAKPHEDHPATNVLFLRDQKAHADIPEASLLAMTEMSQEELEEKNKDLLLEYSKVFPKDNFRHELRENAFQGQHPNWYLQGQLPHEQHPQSRGREEQEQAQRRQQQQQPQQQQQQPQQHQPQQQQTQHQQLIQKQHLLAQPPQAQQHLQAAHLQAQQLQSQQHLQLQLQQQQQQQQQLQPQPQSPWDVMQRQPSAPYHPIHWQQPYANVPYQGRPADTPMAGPSHHDAYGALNNFQMQPMQRFAVAQIQAHGIPMQSSDRSHHPAVAFSQHSTNHSHVPPLSSQPSTYHALSTNPTTLSSLRHPSTSIPSRLSGVTPPVSRGRPVGPVQIATTNAGSIGTTGPHALRSEPSQYNSSWRGGRSPAASPIVRGGPGFGGPGQLSVSMAYAAPTPTHQPPIPTGQVSARQSYSNISARPPSESTTLFFPGVQAPPIATSLVPHDPYEKASVMASLHEILRRSPDRCLDTIHQPQLTNSRYYQYVKKLILAPSVLAQTKHIRTYPFFIPDELHRKLVVARVAPGTRLPICQYQAGSLRCRLKVVRFRASQVVDEQHWIVSETEWPDHIVLKVNAEYLFPQRKAQHSKDLPVELDRDMLAPGENVVEVSLLSMAPAPPGFAYYVAVELVETQSHDNLITFIHQNSMISAESARLAITRRITGADLKDDDIALVSSDLPIDLADPWSAKIWDVPVRGRACTHLECFDLNTWLMSRPHKPCMHATVSGGCPNGCQSTEPSLVDRWKCPMCDLDARPYSLVIDGFLLEVRRELQKQGKLSAVKSIWVSADGTWKPKLGAKVDSEQEDSDTEDCSANAASKRNDGAPIRSETSHPTRAIEIIELD